jgi:hypothetical protein
MEHFSTETAARVIVESLANFQANSWSDPNEFSMNSQLNPN